KDTITDFEHRSDEIVLRYLRDANGGEAMDMDQLILQQAGSTVRIRLDFDRDGIEDRIDFGNLGGSGYGRIDVLDSEATDFTRGDFIF
ncbi:unnamed protein product, partial [Ectocarpus sp. 12 AP-2014]